MWIKNVLMAVVTVVTFATAAATAAAQDESHERPPAFATGLTAGTIHYRGGRTDAALSVALQYSPLVWLTLSAAPGFGHTTSAGTSASGLTDIPISAGTWHSFADAALSPTVSGSLYSSLSVSGSTSGVGIGRNVVG